MGSAKDTEYAVRGLKFSIVVEVRCAVLGSEALEDEYVRNWNRVSQTEAGGVCYRGMHDDVVIGALFSIPNL